MSLPISQQRALEQIEKTLADDHPSLGPLFVIFTGLVRHEAMPVTERVADRPWRLRRMWPTVATLVGLAMVTVALFALSLTLPGRQMCPGMAFSVAARTQSVPAGRQLACPIQPSKPGKASPATAGATP